VIDYSLVALDEEVDQAFLRLFPGDEADKSSERLRWRYNDGPHGPGRIAIARDRDNGGRIVGLIGLIALRLRTGKNAMISFQAVDVVVDPDYRGKGVFAGMGQVALDGAAAMGKQLVWGFPNENAAPAWFGRFGWTRFGTVPFMIRPLRSGYFLRRLSERMGRLDVPLAASRSRSDEDVREVTELGPEFDRLWRNFRLYGPAVDRDARWLRWRLFDRPESRYRVVVTADGDQQIDAMVASVILQRHGGRICYIMEAMGDDTARLARLIRHEVSLAAGKGADAALCWCQPKSPNRRSYRRAGFLPLPDRLRPVTMHFGAKPLPDGIASDIADGASWYLSYLDSDTI
jgi:GNAT superfamily N-acetyltransferase